MVINIPLHSLPIWQLAVIINLITFYLYHSLGFDSC